MHTGFMRVQGQGSAAQDMGVGIHLNTDLYSPALQHMAVVHPQLKPHPHLLDKGVGLWTVPQMQEWLLALDCGMVDYCAADDHRKTAMLVVGYC